MKQKTKVITAAIVISVALAVYFGIRHYQTTRIERLRLLPSHKRYKVLKDLHHFLMRAAFLSQTEPFLMYGTLLGHVREKDLICWDFDLDYGIHQMSYDALYLSVKDLLTDYPNFKLGNDIECSLFHIKMFKVEDMETGLNLDVVAMLESIRDDKRVLTRDYPRFLLTHWFKEKQLDFAFSDIYPLQPISFLDCLSYVPINPSIMLRSWYGDSYLLPDRTCSCERCKAKKSE